MFFHWDYTTDYLEKKNQTCKCEPNNIKLKKNYHLLNLNNKD